MQRTDAPPPVERMPLDRGDSHPPPVAVAIEGLSKTYHGTNGPLRAVDDVAFTVPAGQVFALLGPNGAGKTTLIKMLCGLVTPTAGMARLSGYDVIRQRSAAVLQLGAVLEGSRNVYWSMSAWQNLLYFGRLKGLRGGEIKPRAERLLVELGLWERRSEVVGTFSRGMQQKVAIAAALITDPPIVLLDEPTIGLDVQAARTVKEWVLRLAHEEGKTVVLTTHQLAMAEELADRIAIIRSGRIRADLPVGELLAQFRDDRYRIELSGRLDPSRLSLPEGSAIHHGDGATTLITPVRDQGDLYALLDRLRDLGAPLASVSQVEPDLEDV
ncbi:MAG: ATP-binding cassette domain-containing protein, partial [Dehalococcoidia bacterium]